MQTVKEAREALAREFVRSMHEGDGCPLESDAAVNDAARAVVAAMAEEHGEAWLGQMNRARDAREGPVLWKWDGGLVRNFACSFVVPRADEVLERMLRDREAVPRYCAREDLLRIQAIYARVHALGGETLVWT